MATKDWKLDLESREFDGRITTMHYLRKDERAIISINKYEDGYHFSHFPLGENPEGYYFVKEKLTYSRAISLAKSYMRTH
jgi:hypothetical protein